MRSKGPVIVSFVIGLIVILEYFFKVPSLTLGRFVFDTQEITTWGVILAAFGSGLGAANLLRVHGNAIKFKRKDYIFSYLMIISIIGYGVLGVVQGTSGKDFSYLFDHVYIPLGNALWAFNAFYLASAARRAFVGRNLDAVILLVSSVLVMLGRVGIGESIWKGFPRLAAWIMNVPNAAGMRGIMIGASLGIAAVNLRMLLGIERSQFKGSD